MDYTTSDRIPARPALLSRIPFLRIAIPQLTLLACLLFAGLALPGCDNKSNAACSGSNCECLPGETCAFTCPEGNCNFECPTNANCDISCAGGGCDIACNDGAQCDIECSGGDCKMGCTAADRCDSTCTDGCDLTCVATAQCDQQCSGESCVCVGCEGFGF